MVFISDWTTYIPSSSQLINGKQVPAPSRDEDEISMAYEVLNKLDLPNNARLVFVTDTTDNEVDFHIVTDLVELPTSTISVFQCIDEAFEYSIMSVPSVLVTVRAKPPAGSAAIKFDKRGRIKILLHEFRKESMGFLRTRLTDGKALSDLLSEITSSKMPGILRKFFHSKVSRKHNIKVISGYVRKPKILVKAVNSLKIKNVDIGPVLEVVSSGFENNLAAAFSMIKGLERCNNGEEVLFISEISSGGIYVMITKCGWRI